MKPYLLGCSVLLVLGMGCASAPPPQPPAQDGVLDITSDPMGAEVFIDGQPLGRAPLTKTLKPGRYVMVINYRNTHYEPKMIEIKAGETLKERVVLYADQPGANRENRSRADLHRVQEYFKTHKGIFSTCVDVEEIPEEGLELAVDLYIQKDGTVNKIRIQTPAQPSAALKACVEKVGTEIVFQDMDQAFVYPYATRYSLQPSE
ncbi:MAG: PEGA domain-containing protein [Myxococcota bacterium]